MKRGSMITVAAPGPYPGKPRPAVVVQSDRFTEGVDAVVVQSNRFGDQVESITFCPVTTDIVEDATEVRPIIEPSPENGLRERSQVMVDKVVTVPIRYIGPVFGELSAQDLRIVSDKLKLWLDLF